MGPSDAERIEMLVYDVLRYRDYPDDAVGWGAPFPGRLRPDFTLLDPDTRSIIGVIEAKVVSSDENWAKRRRATQAQLVTYRTASGDAALTAFAAVGTVDAGGGMGLSFYELVGDEFVERPGPPLFHTLRDQTLTRRAEAKSAEVDRVVDSFTTLTRILAAFVSGLFVAAGCGFWDPSWQEMSLGGVAVLLWILPQLSRLKVLGIEIERTTRGRQPGDRVSPK